MEYRVEYEDEQGRPVVSSHFDDAAPAERLARKDSYTYGCLAHVVAIRDGEPVGQRSAYLGTLYPAEGRYA